MIDTPSVTRDAHDLGLSGPDGTPEDDGALHDSVDTDVDGDADTDADTDGDADGDAGTSAADVGPEAARAAWAEAAREQLLVTARRYQAVVTHKELGAAVQERSGIRTKQLQHYWLGDVLQRVAQDCAARGEPNLSSLCVNAAGSVGDGYGLAVADTTGQAPSDPDRHAALARLECYRHFGADLPAGGGAAALTPRLAATRTRTRKAAQEARPVPTCPTCHLALTSSGVCDNCD